MLSDVDLQFAPIKDETGSEQPMSHGRYRLYLESRRRDIRRQAYESMYKAYESQINTVAAIYGSSVKGRVLYAGAQFSLLPGTRSFRRRYPGIGIRRTFWTRLRKSCLCCMIM